MGPWGPEAARRGLGSEPGSSLPVGAQGVCLACPPGLAALRDALSPARLPAQRRPGFSVLVQSLLSFSLRHRTARPARPPLSPPHPGPHGPQEALLSPLSSGCAARVREPRTGRDQPEQVSRSASDRCTS